MVSTKVVNLKKESYTVVTRSLRLMLTRHEVMVVAAKAESGPGLTRPTRRAQLELAIHNKHFCLHDTIPSVGPLCCCWSN